MGRMEFIRDKARRKATFNQRKRNLLKKTSELATLCGISICTIVYGPEIDGCPSEPETWPQNHGEVRRVIDKSKSIMSDKRGRSLNLGDFYKGRIEQVKKQTARVRSQNEARFFGWINELQLDPLKEVLGTLDRSIGVLKTRIELIKKESLQIIEAPPAAAAAAAPEMIDCPDQNKMWSRGEGISANSMQPISVNPLDTFLPMQYSYPHHIVPIDQIPMTMSFSGFDYSKIGNNFMYPPPSMAPNNNNNNPTAVIMENQILQSSFRAPSMMPPYYVDAQERMQPMLPYVHGPMVHHPSVSSGMQPFPPIFDFSDFLANSKKFQ